MKKLLMALVLIVVCVEIHLSVAKAEEFAYDALYCVIDLSGGPSAKAYPVVALGAEPEGGWTDEYKTRKLVLRRIDAGTFTMGAGEFYPSQPHQVTLTKPFYTGVFEVTQKQYELVMGSNPSSYKGDMRPVDKVSYNMIRGTSAGTGWPANNAVDATSFLGKLRTKTGLGLDLPTEAQWEYACRAGTAGDFNIGGMLEDPEEMVRWSHNYGEGKGGYSDAHTTVGSYLPNAWGLYDMHGNVREWCLDWYEEPLSAATDPKGAASGTRRVVRGGSWTDSEYHCASSARDFYAPSKEYGYHGFRLAWTLQSGASVETLTFVPGESVSIDTGLIGYTASGLPSGLKYDKKTGKITGAAKKPTAAEGVTVKFTKRNEPEAEMKIVVGPMPKLSISLEGDTEKCKVKGAGAYLVGKKVSLSATAPKGTAFVGWFVNGAPWPNAEESKNAKLSYVMTKADVSLVAKFEKEKMSVGCAGLEGRLFTVGVAGGVGIPLEIETQSGVKSVKVTKLPAGMKYNAKTGLIEGAPTKAGDFTVQISVTAKSGAVEKKDIAIHVDPLPDWAVGTFVGLVRQVDYDAQGNVVVDGDGRHDWYDGEMTVTVSAQGKISGKLKFPGKGGTGSFSASAFFSCDEDGCVATGSLKSGKEKGTVELRVMPRALTAGGSDFAGDVEVSCRGTELGTGCLHTFSTDENRPLRQQIWKSKTHPLPPSVDKESVTLEQDGLLYTLSFGKDGVVNDVLASADNPKKAIKKGKPVFSVVGYWESAWHCELFGTPIVSTEKDGEERLRLDVSIADDGSVICALAKRE